MAVEAATGSHGAVLCPSLVTVGQVPSQKREHEGVVEYGLTRVCSL
jgi:hypothetical protein